jgi:hypothetical protein
MGPGDANAGRGEAFRAVLRRPTVVSALVVGPSAALVVGAATADAAVALAAPLVVLAATLAWAWRSAGRAAERAFWRAVAEALEFEPFTELGELQRTTPLLHAGERRGFAHELRGPLGESGLTAKLAHYRYEVRREDRDGNGVWEKHRFTVCALDLDAGMELFRGVYLRARRGLVDRAGDDWLRGRRLRRVELESTEFGDAYELLVAADQDDARLRELFDPKTIVWLAEHPLRPHFELRAGFLVVYVPGHLEDLGRIVWLLEAAERLVARVRAEVGEAAAAR